MARHRLPDGSPPNGPPPNMAKSPNAGITADDLVSVERENFRRMRDRVLHFARLPHHSFRKLTNRAITVIDKTLSLRPRAFGMPVHLMVEPTTACQLKCPLCPVGNGMLERPPQFMAFDLYRRAVDELAPYLYQINFNGSGEPLLHPKILAMADEAARHNVFCDVYTNLQTTDDDLLDHMPASGLDRILISLDGADAPTYESYRILGSFDRILDNIARLVKARDATPGSKLAIDIQMVIMKENEHQIDAVQDLVRKLGADSLTIKRTFLFSGTGDEAETSAFLTDNEALRLYQRSDGAGAPAFKGTPQKTCQLLWASSVLLCDGRVSPCCFDYHGWVILGDLHDSTFREIWNGAPYRAFRDQVNRDWGGVKLCNSMIGGCPNMRLRPADWDVKT